ncbi:MAG: ribosomal RNA small subunit methyltransferase A [Deltaproteobacteria bacterium]|nr:ribosomal RNA small subunit methyltransferase A [Deltaproteobacteria bacterium]
MKRTAKSQLRNLDVRPSKKRGQNFLIDSMVLDQIIAIGKPESAKKIVEIGPGLGALTERLAALPVPTVAIEIESKLAAEISSRFPAVQVVNMDILQADLKEFGGELVVFGNIPYSISTDIVFHLLENRSVIDKAILMVQREFAQRMAAAPGSKQYGSLSVAVQLYCECEAGPVVPGSSFHPPANVDSQIIALKFSATPRFDVPDPRWFERVVRASFHQRRKMLANSLRSLGSKSQEEINGALARASIDGTRRAETLSIEEFATLANELAG